MGGAILKYLAWCVDAFEYNVPVVFNQGAGRWEVEVGDVAAAWGLGILSKCEARRAAFE